MPLIEFDKLGKQAEARQPGFNQIGEIYDVKTVQFKLSSSMTNMVPARITTTATSSERRPFSVVTIVPWIVPLTVTYSSCKN